MIPEAVFTTGRAWGTVIIKNLKNVENNLLESEEATLLSHPGFQKLLEGMNGDF